MKIYSHNLIRKVVEKRLKLNIDPLKVGDTIRVRSKLQEKGTQRIQFYIGTLKIKKGTGRKTSRTILSEFGGGIKTTRIFYLNAKSIDYTVILKNFYS
jgi:ribosomal protein L19